MAGTANAIADSKQGLLDRSIFSSQNVYEKELELIFARCWLFLGHECQIPNIHDFTTAYMAEDPVIIWRDGDGKIRAFLNMCRHRGNRLCLADAGNASSFMCTYHGWTYRSDGALDAVPGQTEVYGNKLDLSEWGLVEVAQLDTYKGLIFATFDATAPPLIDYIGHQKPHFDFLLDRRVGGTELLSGVHKWVMKTNWKYPADNFGGDDGHHIVTHASVRKVPVDSVTYGADMTNQYTRHNPDLSGEDQARMEKTLSLQPSGVIRDYFREHFPETLSRIGEEAYRENVVETLFPNLSINSYRHMIRVWHPRGPDATEMWSHCVVDKDAPAEVKDALRHHLTQTFGPAGNFEQDDINNWQNCTSTARGWIARQYPQNIQAGLTDEPQAELGRKLGARLRALYTKWGVMMEARGWGGVDLKSQDWT